MDSNKYSNPARLHWYPDLSCPVCGGKVNSWDKRCSWALGYKQIVCENCIAHECEIVENCHRAAWREDGHQANFEQKKNVVRIFSDACSYSGCEQWYIYKAPE